LELSEGASVFGVSQTFMREGVPAPAGGENWNHNAIRRIVLSDLYEPHSCEEVRAMVSPEVAARLDLDCEYGVWWFNTKRTTRRYVSKMGPNGKEYVEEQRSRPKPKEEWIAVPVPLDEDFIVLRPVVEAARMMKSAGISTLVSPACVRRVKLPASRFEISAPGAGHWRCVAAPGAISAGAASAIVNASRMALGKRPRGFMAG
jgi:hypothetical protein